MSWNRMNILVSKINQVGDAVTFLPTLQGLTEAFPRARITVLCNPVGKQIFEDSVRGLSYRTVDNRKIRSPRGALFQLLDVARGLRRGRFTASLHSYDDPTFSYVLAALLRIRRRVGFRSRAARGQGLQTENLGFDLQRPVVDINFDLVRHISERADARPRRVPIGYRSEDGARVQQCLRDLGVAQPFIAIHPGAKAKYREWGLANYMELAARLRVTAGMPTVFVTERPTRTLPYPVATNLSVKQLAGLLDLAAAFVGNNSGPMHVASAMGTPSVIIEGPAAPNWEFPWHDVPHRTLRATHLACVPCDEFGKPNLNTCLNVDDPMSCMKGISVASVEDAVLALIRNTDIRLHHKEMSER